MLPKNKISRGRERLMIKAAICDDDKLFTGQLERQLYTVSEGISIPLEADIFFDGAGLLEELNRGTRYDIIFMDIEMEQIDGISAAKQLRHLDPTALLVYISSHDRYFRQLFEVGVFRFLDKPVDTERLSECFTDACRQISGMNACFEYTCRRAFFRIPFRDIAYFESERRVIHLYLGNGEHREFYGKLNRIEEGMKAEGRFFLRSHQSYLLNYDYIRRMDGTSVTLAVNGEEIRFPISPDRQNEMSRQLCELKKGKWNI